MTLGGFSVMLHVYWLIVHWITRGKSPNEKANLPGPLQRLHAARNRNAAPVKFSDWFAGASYRVPTALSANSVEMPSF